LAELGKDFPEAESKGYDSKTLTKKAKAWEGILTRFNSQIPNGIKRDLSQLQGCRRRLNLQWKKEHDSLADIEAIVKKGAEKVAKYNNQLFYEVTDRVLPKAKTQSKVFVDTVFL